MSAADTAQRGVTLNKLPICQINLSFNQRCALKGREKCPGDRRGQATTACIFHHQPLCRQQQSEGQWLRFDIFKESLSLNQN